MKLHYNLISVEMKSLLHRLMSIPEFHVFRLVGGTSLALQLGHRSSVDLDLFAGGGAPTPKAIGEVLTQNFQNLHVNRFMQFGLTASIEEVKVDIYDWKVPFSQEPVLADNIRLATVPDIFAFKCEALLGRRAEKDFADIAEISKHYSLHELFSVFQKRYPAYSKGAILAILLKPEVFERDVTIRYVDANSWEQYCEVMKKSIQLYENQILGKKQKEINDRDKKIQDLINQKRNKNS